MIRILLKTDLCLEARVPLDMDRYEISNTYLATRLSSALSTDRVSFNMHEACKSR